MTMTAHGPVFELTVGFEPSEEALTVTIKHGAEQVGLLVLPGSQRVPFSETLFKERRDAIAGVFLSAMNHVYKKARKEPQP